MKTRNGFVSNSSSSSFIVGFKKVPTADYEMLEVLFPIGVDGKRHGVNSPYGDGGVDATSAAKIIFDDLAEQKKPLTAKEIREEITSGYFEGYPQLNFNSDRESDRIRRDYNAATGKDVYDKDADPKVVKAHTEATQRHWKEQQKMVDEAAKSYWKKVKAKFKGLKCYRFSYSDNDGQVFCTLEHGNTFDSLPHIRISHH